MASVRLPSTSGETVDLSALRGRVVVYAYPRTGRPGMDDPDGWDMIPGARGCTPQSCSFRDHFAELTALGVDRLFGLSTQDSEYQREAAERLHLPFSILSDDRLNLTRAMKLPTFEASGMTLLKRFTLVIDDGVVTHVFYPVFPPDRSAADVIEWLSKKT
jgi:peroxiredoxin